MLKKIIFILFILILTSKICPGSMGQCQSQMKSKNFRSAFSCFQREMDVTKDKSIYYFLIHCSRQLERKGGGKGLISLRRAATRSRRKKKREGEKKSTKRSSQKNKKNKRRRKPIGNKAGNQTGIALQLFKEFKEVMERKKKFKSKKERFYYNYRFYLAHREFFKYLEGKEYFEISKKLLEKNLIKKLHKIEIANFYLTAGFHYFNLEDYNEAIKMYKKSKEYNPYWQSSYYFLAKTYLFNEDYENAKKYAKKSIKLNRGFKDSPLARQSSLIAAVIDYKMEKYKNALGKLKRIIKNHPEYLDAYLLRARIYLKLKDISKAEKAMREIESIYIISSGPHPGISLLKADILFHKKEYDEALELYKGLLKNDMAKKLKFKGYDIKRRKARVDYIERRVKAE